MPRYFFDVHDGALERDDVGTEWASLDEVQLATKHLLPAIAREKITRDGDRHVFTVLVRDERNTTIYTATLGFNGIWVNDPPLE